MGKSLISTPHLQNEEAAYAFVRSRKSSFRLTESIFHPSSASGLSLAFMFQVSAFSLPLGRLRPRPLCEPANQRRTFNTY